MNPIFHRRVHRGSSIGSQGEGDHKNGEADLENHGKSITRPWKSLSLSIELSFTKSAGGVWPWSSTEQTTFKKKEALKDEDTCKG